MRLKAFGIGLAALVAVSTPANAIPPLSPVILALLKEEGLFIGGNEMVGGVHCTATILAILKENAICLDERQSTETGCANIAANRIKRIGCKICECSE